MGSVAGAAFTISEEKAWAAVRTAQKNNPGVSPREVCANVGLPFTAYLAAYRKYHGSTKKPGNGYNPADIATDREAFGVGTRGRAKRPGQKALKAPWWVAQGLPHPASRKAKEAARKAAEASQEGVQGKPSLGLDPEVQRALREFAAGEAPPTELSSQETALPHSGKADEVVVIILRGSPEAVARALKGNLEAALCSR